MADEMHYDAIVVGSGISGGWAAKELTEKGLKVLGGETVAGTDHAYVVGRQGLARCNVLHGEARTAKHDVGRFSQSRPEGDLAASCLSVPDGLHHGSKLGGLHRKGAVRPTIGPTGNEVLLDDSGAQSDRTDRRRVTHAVIREAAHHVELLGDVGDGDQVEIGRRCWIGRDTSKEGELLATGGAKNVHGLGHLLQIGHTRGHDDGSAGGRDGPQKRVVRDFK